MKVTYLEHHRINKTKWDDCLQQAHNNLIYAQSYYLDIVSPGWDALVANDYEFIMPLTHRKKMGIKYLAQPAFTQQLGIFSKEKTILPSVINLFLEEASQRFHFAEINLNYGNSSSPINDSYKLQPKNNYVLSLSSAFAEQEKKFTDHFNKSLRRIKKFNLRYAEEANYTDIISIYWKQLTEKKATVKKEDFLILQNLCHYLHHQKKLIVRKAFITPNQWMAACILFVADGRIYNMVSCLNNEGRLKEANYFLYYKIIEEFSEQEKLLDLEGSDLKSVANFYQKMGPINQQYLYVKYNFLPGIIKLLKK